MPFRLLLLIPLCVLACFAAPAWAGEPTLDGTVDAIIAALDAKDAAELERLAALDIDAWLVVNKLFSVGRQDAAAAFAVLRKGPADAQLAAYAASLKDHPSDAAFRKAWAAYVEHAKGRRLGDAWKALDVDLPCTAVERVMQREAQGLLRQVNRQLDQALELYASAARDATTMGWLRRAFQIHERASVVTQQMGSPRHGLPHSRAMVSIAKRLQEVELEVQALHMHSAFLSQTRTDDKEALSGFRRCLELLADKSGPVADGVRMMVLSNIAPLERDMGLYDQAAAHLRESMAIAERLPDRVAVARGLAGLAGIEEVQGHYARAVALYEQSMALLRELTLLYADHRQNLASTLRGAGIVLFNLAALHASAGHYARALAAYDEAIEVGRRAGDLSTIADGLTQRGFLQRRLGQPAAARAAYREAIPLYEKIGDARQLATLHQAMGTAWSTEGEHEKALDAITESERRFEALGETPRLMHARGSRACELVALGRVDEALPLFHQAIESARRADMPKQLFEFLVTRAGMYLDHRDDLEAADRDLEEALALPWRDAQAGVIARAHQVLATLRIRQERYAEAVLASRAGIVALEVTQRGLADQEAALARDRWMPLFDFGLIAAATAGRVDDVHWLIERARGQLLAGALGSREALLAAEIPDALRAEETDARLRVAQAREALQRAQRRRQMERRRHAQAKLAEALADHERVLLRVQRGARLAADVAFLEPTPIQQVQGLLASDALYLALAPVGERILALRIDETEARIVNLGKQEALRGLLDALDLHDPEADVAKHLAELRATVLDPLELPSSVRTVIVSAGGIASRICWSALDATRAYVHTPSATTWHLLSRERSSTGTGILAVGDPDYGVTSQVASDARRRAGTLAPLPATRAEVRRVGTRTLLGREATEDGVWDAIAEQERWRAIHFACHGLIDSEKPQFSSLAITPSPANDGFLTVAEVASRSFRADLVVLSACDTARGRVYASEGVLGLTRAFMQAGAPRVICSAWKVDDAATSALMIEFYRRWNPPDGTSGVPAAHALRQAQAYIRSKPAWRHPYYWAAWSVWGLPR